MSDREHAADLLESARRDLKALHGMDDTSVFSDEIFGFHAQQSVEKALNARLAALGSRFPHSHDLQRLIELLDEKGIATDGLNDFVDLNPFAVQYRYETLYADEDPLDRAALRTRIAGLIQLVGNAIDT